MQSFLLFIFKLHLTLPLIFWSSFTSKFTLSSSSSFYIFYLFIFFCIIFILLCFTVHSFLLLLISKLHLTFVLTFLPSPFLKTFGVLKNERSNNMRGPKRSLVDPSQGSFNYPAAQSHCQSLNECGCVSPEVFESVGVFLPARHLAGTSAKLFFFFD